MVMPIIFTLVVTCNIEETTVMLTQVFRKISFVKLKSKIVSIYHFFLCNVHFEIPTNKYMQDTKNNLLPCTTGQGTCSAFLNANVSILIY